MKDQLFRALTRALTRSQTLPKSPAKNSVTDDEIEEVLKSLESELHVTEEVPDSDSEVHTISSAPRRISIGAGNRGILTFEATGGIIQQSADECYASSVMQLLTHVNNKYTLGELTENMKVINETQKGKTTRTNEWHAHMIYTIFKSYSTMKYISVTGVANKQSVNSGYAIIYIYALINTGYLKASSSVISQRNKSSKKSLTHTLQQYISMNETFLNGLHFHFLPVDSFEPIKNEYDESFETFLEPWTKLDSKVHNVKLLGGIAAFAPGIKPYGEDWGHCISFKVIYDETQKIINKIVWEDTYDATAHESILNVSSMKDHIDDGTPLNDANNPCKLDELTLLFEFTERE